jgi:predicted double-glycine peptidase
MRATYASAQAPTRVRVAPGRVVDAWPDAPPLDPYDTAQVMGATGMGATAMRQRVTARPVTREQRTVVTKHPVIEHPVIEHPWNDEFEADESGVHEFSQQLDFLIAATNARQQAVLPKPKPAKGKRAVGRMGVMAAVATRAGLGFLIVMAIVSGITALTGHPPIPISALPLPILGASDVGSNEHWTVDTALLGRIQPLTQLKRADQYDNHAQFSAWGGSACSAAVLAEILTAYGVQHATIGRTIDELGSDISVQWGLESYSGFAKVAAKHGLRAEMYVDHPLTYKQMLYLTNTLGIPIIVNVRATSGYYHFLSGGHFLVMTGGDAQTVRLVDSSEYYIKSLPLATFMGMYRNRSVAIMPKDYQYTLPA